jgi:hypothetical protein
MKQGVFFSLVFLGLFSFLSAQTAGELETILSIPAVNFVQASRFVLTVADVVDEKTEAGEAYAAWEKALALYERREFRAAGGIFNTIDAHNEKDGAARLYVNMCRNYIAAPPPPDWDGVNNLSRK